MAQIFSISAQLRLVVRLQVNRKRSSTISSDLRVGTRLWEGEKKFLCDSMCGFEFFAHMYPVDKSFICFIRNTDVERRLSFTNASFTTVHPYTNMKPNLSDVVIFILIEQNGPYVIQ